MTTFIQFCETDSFKRYVRAAIQDELFLDRIFNNHQIEQRVKTCTKKYLDDKLGDQVHQAVCRQLPSIVQDSHTVQQLLQRHTEQLEKKLEAKSHQIVDGIVNDPKYHVVNERYFRAFERKGDQQITQVQQQSSEAIQRLSQEMNRVKDLEKKTDQLKNLTVGMIGCTMSLVIGGIAYLYR